MDEQATTSGLRDPFDLELERLRREVEHFTRSGIIEIAVRNPNVASYMKHWEDRAQRAEESIRHLNDLRLTWAMVCECECKACEALSSAIRKASQWVGSPPSALYGAEMKKRHFDWLQTEMALLLSRYDDDGGNPEFCDDALATRMAKAAELVYDSCMAGQAYVKTNK